MYMNPLEILTNGAIQAPLILTLKSKIVQTNAIELNKCFLMDHFSYSSISKNILNLQMRLLVTCPWLQSWWQSLLLLSSIIYINPTDTNHKSLAYLAIRSVLTPNQWLKGPCHRPMKWSCESTTIIITIKQSYHNLWN